MKNLTAEQINHLIGLNEKVIKGQQSLIDLANESKELWDEHNSGMWVLIVPRAQKTIGWIEDHIDFLKALPNYSAVNHAGNSPVAVP